MNTLKRALKVITRRKTKTILLIITFFLIGNLVILGMGISQAAENAKVMTRKSMNPVVSYDVDYEGFFDYTEELEDEDEQEEAYKNFPEIKLTDVENIGEDPRVKGYNAISNGMTYVKDLQGVPIGNERENEENNFEGPELEEGEVQIVPGYGEPSNTLIGNAFPTMIELEDGTFTVTSGRFYTQEDIDQANKVCLVTTEYADVNGLSVGDTITMIDPGANWEYQELKEMFPELTPEDFYTDVEIIGIYETTKTVDPGAPNFDWLSAYDNPKNSILMPSSTIATLNEKIADMHFEKAVSEGWAEEGDRDEYGRRDRVDQVIFLLEDPLVVDEFVEEYTPNLPQFMKLDANNSTFKKMARPLDTLSFFSNIVVWIVIVNAIVIISLVTALTLKTRQYEMGVLLSIGVSKMKVVTQLFLELIVIALIGFALSSISGSMIAGRVGDMVLNYQQDKEAHYEDLDNEDVYSGIYYPGDGGGYFTQVSQDQLLENYEVHVSGILIAEIFGIGAIVVLLAIIVPSFMIMRLNPKQILLEQN